jgi:hypothetical protein
MAAKDFFELRLPSFARPSGIARARPVQLQGAA